MPSERTSTSGMGESVKSGYQQGKKEFLSSEFDYGPEEKATGTKMLSAVLGLILFSVAFWVALGKIAQWLLAK